MLLFDTTRLGFIGLNWWVFRTFGNLEHANAKIMLFIYLFRGYVYFLVLLIVVKEIAYVIDKMLIWEYGWKHKVNIFLIFQ